jgi:dipeptidyl aminopeptidase/acylaminoacyl peptidase
MIKRPGSTFALCLPALLLGSTALSAQARDDLAAHLAMPIASNLAGARDVPRFAWIENAAGARNIWIGGPDMPAHALTNDSEDDGVELSDVTLSNDGATIAFVRGGDSEYPDGALPNTSNASSTPRQELFVIPAGGGAPLRVGEGHTPAFSANGERIAFTRKGEIWLWERASGSARRLATVAAEVGRLTWSPDGTRLLFTDDRGDHSFVGLLDVATGKPSYLQPGLGSAEEPTFSPDGQQIAFISFVDPPADAPRDTGSYWSLKVANVRSGETRMLWTAPEGMGGRYYGTRSRNLFWSADGKLLFPSERSGWVHAWAIDAKGGEARDLTPGDFEVEAFLLGADGRSIIYAANADNLDSRHLWRRPLDGGPAVRLTNGSDFANAPTLGGATLAALVTDATHPAHIVTVGKTMAPLGPAPSAPGFVAPEAVTFTAADGMVVHATLFHARGPGKHPALIHVHGGPRRQMLPGFHQSLYYSNAYVLNQHFAAEGYDVLSVNYRSGTGYGRAFRDAPEIARGGASEYRDVLAGAKLLAARGDVDPARIGIWGGSWGGYLTALALARNSDLFAAGVDFHGVHTMVRPADKVLPPATEAGIQQLQWQSSPMGSVATWRSPVLLIHGDDDHNVDFQQSLLLARELTARHVSFQELVFPGERHDFFRYADWLTSYRAADAFLDRTLMKKQPLP